MTQGHMRNFRAHLKTQGIDVAVTLEWLSVMARCPHISSPSLATTLPGRFYSFLSEDFEAHWVPVTFLSAWS